MGSSFRIRRESVEDTPRPGAPITSVVPKTSDAIKKLIELDPLITIRELSTRVGIKMGSVDRILKTHLKLIKVCVAVIC